MGWLYKKPGAHLCSDTRPDSGSRAELAGRGSLWQCDCSQVWEVTGHAGNGDGSRLYYIWRRFTGEW